MRPMQFVELTTDEQVAGLIAAHNERSRHVVLDIETTGLDPFADSITSVVISGVEPGRAASFAPRFIPHLAKLRKPLVLHNFKFDFRMLFRAGVDLRDCGPVRDTMLLHHLLDEEAPHGLDDIVQAEYGDKYKELFWAKYKSFEEAPHAEGLEYACKDVIYTGMIYELFLTRLRADSVPDSLVEHVHRLALSLYRTELEGLCVDMDYLMATAMELKPSIDRYRVEMRQAAPWACEAVELDLWAKEINKLYKPGPRARAWRTVERPEFNFDSSAHLVKLFYDKLGLPPRYNKARNLSTDDKALESLSFHHTVVEMVRDYRTFQKVYTAFIEGTLERIHNDRIYPSFNVNGTVTGRISSSNPNMQQLPSKGVWSKVRGIYRAEAGHKIVTCDYSQLEVCIAAHFSLDPNLLKIIYEGASKHDLTATGVGIPRHLAKTLNFAMQYQCSPRKVKEIVGCSDADAELIWNKYWETYAKEKEVIDACKAKVDAGEPIVNLFGRKRRFPAKFDAKWKKEAAYRQAYSSLIQGTGADCTHEAFYTIAETMQEMKWGRALFEVHDEIVNMPKESYCTESSNMVKSVMQGIGTRIGLRVPLTVDCSEPLERWTK